jgi:hypothetical protein
MKKKAILLVVGCVLLIILAITLMTRANKRVEQDTTLILPTAVQQQVSVQDVTMAPPNQQNQPTNLVKWQTYKGDTFTFQYPPEWTVQTTGVSGGGTIVIVKPQALPSGINYPQFVLQSQPWTSDAESTKAGFLEGFGMKQEDTTVDGLKAKKFSGAIPFKTVGDQTLKQPVHDTTYLITNNNVLYVLKYEYDGADQSDMLEDFFTGFTDSFKTGQ